MTSPSGTPPRVSPPSGTRPSGTPPSGTPPSGTPQPVVPQRIGWRSFSAAPHRLFLWGGALYGVVAVALWTAQQASLYAGLGTPLLWRLPYPAAHGFMMLYGWAGFYLFGFLLTTFPRWLDTAPVPRGVYLAAWALLNAGAHGFWLGLFLGRPLALAACLALLLGYGTALAACLASLLRTERRERGQQVSICYGLAMGMVGIALAAWAVATGAPWAWRAVRWIGIYPFLLQVVLAVVYRMVPFFTGTVTPGYEVRRSALALPLLAVALFARAALGYAGAHALAWTADALLLALLVREMVLWRFWRANFPPLLTILYLALGWIALSFALSLGEGLFLFAGGGPVPPFRNAALHALAVGGFGGLILGISTRVSLGHSGGGLATNRLLNALFIAFQAVPLARVVPEVAGYWLPRWSVQGFWAGLGWVAVFGVWLAAVGPILMRPRSDGRPG
jgi:uncharacterized protein involved in response to NO